MLFVLIGLWVIGLLLLLTDPKRTTTRWISCIAFTGGSGGLSAVIADDIVPLAQSHLVLTDRMASALYTAELASSLLCYYGLPYTFIMFAIHYYPNYALWKPSWKRFIPWLLLLPIAVSFLFEPRPGDSIPYIFVSFWSTPYILAGIVLLILSVRMERNSFLRRSRLLTTAAAAPTLFFAMFTLYLLPAYFHLYELWRYNAGAIAITLAIIVGSSFRYGFMGLQISIQNQKLDYTLRAITSGTSILNHAIKNDVGKIRLFSDKIKADALAGQSSPEQVVQDVEVIMAASQHIYDMIYRIHGQTQEVELKLEVIRPAEVLSQCLRMLSLDLRNIQVQEFYAFDGEMLGDRAQPTEVWTNVISNAVEAMPQGGSLTVRLTETKRKVVVEIKDSGSGMNAQQLKRVFDPFYTTKGGKKLNFGLGLSYCYTIVQKHKGAMSMDSKPGQGTSVFMQFPKLTRADARKGETLI